MGPGQRRQRRPGALMSLTHRGTPWVPPRLLDGAGDLDGPLPAQLLLGQLLERHRERLAVGAGVDHRRHELADALAELGVVAVDLARAPRSQINGYYSQ